MAASATLLDDWRERYGPERSRQRAHRPLRREFTAATIRPMTASWTTADRHVNQSLLTGLRVLRARSRDLERNNDYAKHFLRLVEDNVVGPTGVSFQVHAANPDGTIDQADSGVLERTFARWGSPGNCDVARRLTFVARQRLIIRTIARDGEILIRRWQRGPFNYQHQLLDPALLNEHYNVDDLRNGNRIRMGIEVDSFDAPVAYHLLRRETNDPRTLLSTSSADYVRVPASEIWHLYVSEFVGQYRGVPWMSTTLVRQKRLGSYEEAAVAAAEEGAKKLAWIQSPDGDIAPLADSTREGATDAESVRTGTLATDSQDIAYGHLPPGYSVEGWDPKYPEANFGPFVKATLRGIASGLGVSYHKLGNDLEGVNYSSTRTGELNERDVWKALQGWLIDMYCAPTYSEWLRAAILTAELPLPPSRLPKFDAAVWQGRRWDWVDPEKDVNANVTAIENGLTSRSRVIRNMGNDPDEIWAELEAEQKRLAGLLPVPGTGAPKPAPTEGAAA